MTEHLQPGPHLDADQLAAFAEGVLPAHEREACLLHLAGCAACREVLFLAQAASEEPVSAPVLVMPAPLWRRMAPLAVATALAACLVTAVLVLRPKHPTVPPPDVAQLAPIPMQDESSLPEPPAIKTEPPVQATPNAAAQPHPKPTAPAKTPGTAPVMDKSAEVADQSVAAPAPSSTGAAAGGGIAALPLENRNTLNYVAPQGVAGSASGTGIALRQMARASAPALPSPGGPLTLRIEPGQSLNGTLAKLSGAVLDPTGASIAGATVALQPPTGAAPKETKTDLQGNFYLAGLTPGHYNVQISASGFMTVTRPLDLHPSDLAQLTTQLPVGASTETVTVTAAMPILQTESASVVGVVPMKAMKQTVTEGKRILGLDPEGTISLSTDRGKHWKQIKPVWPGKIVHIAASSSGKGFEITTDADIVWTSPDGKHWRQR